MELNGIIYTSGSISNRLVNKQEKEGKNTVITSWLFIISYIIIMMLAGCMLGAACINLIA